MTPEQIITIARQDPKQIIEALFWVENKDGVIVPYKFNDVQNEWYADTYLPLRTKSLAQQLTESPTKILIDILKARQQGFSTIILALFTVDFLVFPNLWCVSVSHESEATKRLFRKVQNFIKRLPFPVPLDTSRNDMLVNKNNGSIFYIGTAGSKSFGHGDTIHRLHLSEYSRYKDAQRVIKNITPAVPESGIIIKETTANGANNTHHLQWKQAKEGKNGFFAFFSPWYKSREYSNEPASPLVLTQEERKLIETFPALNQAKINWRRNKIQELGSTDSFKEQFPITDFEAFIASGASAFSKEALEWYYNTTCREPSFIGVFDESAAPRLQSDEKGYIKIWQKPRPNSLYFISADVGKSVNYCAASVWHWGTLEQVATIHGQFEPDVFGEILYKIGMLYNVATLIPENNKDGAAVIVALKYLEYENIHSEKARTEADESNTAVTNYGFNTNTRTRPLIIAAGQKAIRDHGPTIRDADYIFEAQGFQRNKDGKYEAATNEEGVEQDDRVIDFLIGMHFYQTNPIPQFSGYAGHANPMAESDNNNNSNQTQELDTFDDFT